MTQDVQDAVIQFIKQKIGTSKSLGVTWYGGEPTLALDVIEYISANLIEYCIDNGLDYSAGIITNGYLLTRETVSLLNKFKVQFYQITLDAMYNFSFIQTSLRYNESPGAGTGSCAGACCVCSSCSRMSCDGSRHAMFPSR